MKKVLSVVMMVAMIMSIIVMPVLGANVVTVGKDDNGEHVISVVKSASYVAEGKEIPMYTLDFVVDTGKEKDLVGDFYGAGANGGKAYHIGPDNWGWIGEVGVGDEVKKDQALADRIAKGIKINGRTVWDINSEAGGPGACQILMFDNENGNTFRLYMDSSLCKIGFDENSMNYDITDLTLEITEIPNPLNIKSEPMKFVYEEGKFVKKSVKASIKDKQTQTEETVTTNEVEEKAEDSTNPKTGDTEIALLMVSTVLSGAFIVSRKLK